MEVVRTCVGCRQRAPQAELLRLVRDGERAVDGTRPRLPGRGAYLHRSAACLDLAERRRAVHRALGVPLDPGLREELASGWNGEVAAR